MKIKIRSVRRGAPAWSAGIRAGDHILSINGEEVIDEIDYQALTSEALVRIDLEGPDGARRHTVIRKAPEEPLGLEMDESFAITPRLCANKCVFCFVEQMPEGLRPSLYVKDDDWRMSLMMGSFITLTNVGEKEFSRILRRRASPLYISVHTTNMALREKMLGCPRAGLLMDQLGRLTAQGLDFHAQVVLCPGWNDGPELDRTLSDLAAFRPHVKSVALVPVGLTRFRDGLTPLTPYDAQGAAALLEQTERWQGTFLDRFGTRLVFPADEFYSLAGREPPDEDAYEGYPQIENGVGMLRQLEQELSAASRLYAGTKADDRHVTIACGTGMAPHMERLLTRWGPVGLRWRVIPVVNHFFGETVTVSGLMTGRDLAKLLRDEKTDQILITRSILRSEGDMTLDNMTVEELRAALPAPVTFVGDGFDLYEALLYQERHQDQ